MQVELAPWPARAGLGMAVLSSGTTILAGGEDGDAYFADCWASHDEGARPNGSLVLVAGFLDGVWVSGSNTDTPKVVRECGISVPCSAMLCCVVVIVFQDVLVHTFKLSCVACAM